MKSIPNVLRLQPFWGILGRKCSCLTYCPFLNILFQTKYLLVSIISRVNIDSFNNYFEDIDSVFPKEFAGRKIVHVYFVRFTKTHLIAKEIYCILIF